MSRLSRFTALLLAVLFFAATAFAAELRNWSDASGKFNIKAKFVSEAKGTVTLEQEDGTQVEIELSKLSAADQKYVADQKGASDSPFKKKSKSDSPFKPKAKEKEKPADVIDPPLTPVNRASAKIIDLNSAKAAWKVPACAAPTSEATPKIISVPAKANFFEGVKGLAVNLVAQRAVIGYNTDDHRSGGVTRLVIIDLAAGAMIANGTVPGLYAPLALADDGQRIIMRRDEFGHGKQDRLEIWSFGDGTIKKTVRWVPYGDLQHGHGDVKMAEFLADGRLVTCSGSGIAVIWDLDPLKPVMQLPTRDGCIPCVSPDRKLVAFATDKEIGVYDPTSTGRVLGLGDMPNTPWPALAFSPDGAKLGCVGMDRLLVWDTTTGELQREVSFTNTHVGGKIAWAGNNHVLVGGRVLLDLELQIRLWEYQNGDGAVPAGGLIWFVANERDRGPGALVAAKLPNETVLAKLAKAKAEPDFFVLKPGVRVKIDTSGLGDAGQRDKVTAALAAKLTANDCTASGNGTITLTAATEVGKEREVSYHTFGRPFGNQTYKVQEHTSKVQFVYQGKVAWTAAAGNIPFFVRLAEGETMEQYLRNHEKPNYEWFEKVSLPKLLTKPTGQMQGLGTSQVTPAGVR